MRNVHTPLLAVFDSFLLHRHDLSPATVANYTNAVTQFDRWVRLTLGRDAEVADVEPGTVETFLVYRKQTASAQSARSAWVALRSIAKFLAERKIQHDRGDSILRLVRMPKVKDDSRRALTDQEMWRLIERAGEGEMDERDRAIGGNAVRKLFERLKVRTGITDLCAHMNRHTWGTNFHRSGSGSRFDLMVEGGWTTPRMVERYVKARPFEERRKAPSPFTAAQASRR